MQQFTIPQFIDVEDKIIGPITTRQFIIMLAGFLFMGTSYKLFDFSLFLTIAVLIFIAVIAFSFVKINGRPFHFFLLNLVQTFKRPKIRVWNHTFKKTEREEETAPPVVSYAPPVKSYTASRLAELSLIVDTKGVYQEEQNKETTISSVDKIYGKK